MCKECGSPAIHDTGFTEDICEDCQEGDHDQCDRYTEQPCACYNSKHLIGDKEKFVERFIEAATAGRNK